MKLKVISFNGIKNHLFQWSYDMKYFCRTALYMAVGKENIEIIKLLLANDKIDINQGYIINIFFIKFEIISFNEI